MTNEQPTTTNEIANPLLSEEEFLKQLDNQTGYQGQLSNLPIIKFQAKNGVFVINRGEKDEEGKLIFSEIGKDLKVHLLNVAYALTNSGDNSPVKVYSQEFTGQNVILFNQETRKIEAEGKYAELKPKFDLRYTKVAYASYNNELVRIKLSGFSLTNFFKFLTAKGNPSKYELTFKLGRRMKGTNNQECVEATKKEVETYKSNLAEGIVPSLNLFYEYTPIITKELWHTPEDRHIIIERVNAVNSYLLAKNMGTITAMPKEAESELIPLSETASGDVLPFA